MLNLLQTHRIVVSLTNVSCFLPQDSTDVIGVETPDALTTGEASNIPQLFGAASQEDNAVLGERQAVNAGGESLVFDPMYLYVGEEGEGGCEEHLNDHERHLLLEYKAKEMAEEQAAGKGKSSSSVETDS